MKERILSGWSVRRIVYLIGGLAMTAFAYTDKQWAVGVFGLYFIAMGVFALGCASGNCAVPVNTNSSDSLDNVEFEEVK